MLKRCKRSFISVKIEIILNNHSIMVVRWRKVAPHYNVAKKLKNNPLEIIITMRLIYAILHYLHYLLFVLFICSTFPTYYVAPH